MTHPVQTTPLPFQIPGFQQAWEMVTGQLRAEMSRGDFETWVRPILPLSYERQVFTLGVYNPYARDMVEARLKSRITQLLSGTLNEPVTVRLVISNGYYRGEDAAPLTESGTTVTEKETPVPAAAPGKENGGSPRKLMLARAYGSERARLIQPERGMFLTLYFFNNWVPLIGHSAAMAILAARSLCYWNPMTGELRNTIETEMAELAARASVSVRTLKDVLAGDLVQRYFLRYRVRRMMTPNGIRTAGITLLVRMDDPLTPADQEKNGLPEEERWYPADYEDESED